MGQAAVRRRLGLDGVVPPKKVAVTLWLTEEEADRWRRSLEPARAAIVQEGRIPPTFEDFLVMLCREGFRAVIRQSSPPTEPERMLILTPAEAALRQPWSAPTKKPPGFTRGASEDLPRP